LSPTEPAARCREAAGENLSSARAESGQAEPSARGATAPAAEEEVESKSSQSKKEYHLRKTT